MTRRTLAGRRGSILALVIVCLCIVGLLAMALMDRSLSSSSRASWGRDHLTLRLMADSACEELFAQLARESNDPSKEAFRRLRTLIPDEGEPTLPIAVTGLECPLVREDLVGCSVALGAALDVAFDVSIQRVEEVSDDAHECRAIVRVTAAVTATRRFFGMTERATVDRVFHVARETIHHPLQEDALIVKRLPKPEDEQEAQGEPGGEGAPAGPPDGGGAGPEGPPGQGGPPGGGPGAEGPGEEPAGEGSDAGAGEPHSFFTPHIVGVRTMTQVMGGDAGEGMRPSPPEWVEEVADAIRYLHPREARRRAQFETRWPRQLRWFVSGRLRRGLPVHGLIYCDARKPLLLDLERFSGRAVIASRGPIVLGNVTLADPRNDRLTIASGRRIIVVGDRIDANLVSFGGRRKGVKFQTKTRVNGTIVSQRVPKSRTLSKEDFQASQIGSVEGEDYSGNENQAPPPGQVDLKDLKNYCVAFSPQPNRVDHAAE